MIGGGTGTLPSMGANIQGGGLVIRRVSATPLHSMTSLTGLHD